MNRDLNPPEILLSIAKLKYRIALFPVLMVVISLTMSNLFNLPEMRYISLFGLITFLFVLTIFRVNVSAITEEKMVVSPISGKIVSIDRSGQETTIVIQKKFFHSADIKIAATGDYIQNDRASVQIDKPQKRHNIPVRNREIDLHWFVKGDGMYYFANSYKKMGSIIGILPGNGCCIMTISSIYQLEINEGAKVTVGETVIGSTK